MSWIFTEKGFDVKRISNSQLPLLRKEIYNYLRPVINQTNGRDYYRNSNLFIPNPMKEKDSVFQGNGDLDVFCYINDKVSFESILMLLQKTEQIKDSFFNNKCLTFLFQSKLDELNWNFYQIDLHLVQDKKLFLNSYFDYYRVPYLLDFIWRAFSKLNISIWQDWVKINVNIEEIGKKWMITLEENLYKFLENVLNINPELYSTFDSYDSMISFLNSLNGGNLVKYIQFWEKELSKNDKMNYIYSKLNKKGSTEEEMTLFFNEILNKINSIETYKEIISSFKNKEIES